MNLLAGGGPPVTSRWVFAGEPDLEAVDGVDSLHQFSRFCLAVIGARVVLVYGLGDECMVTFKTLQARDDLLAVKKGQNSMDIAAGAGRGARLA